MKAKTEDIISFYNKTKNIKETSKFFHMTQNGVACRLKKLGVFRKEWCKRKNDFYFENNYVVLVCKNKEKIIIDKDDFSRVSRHKWCVSKTGYAVSNINKKVTKMHRFILGIDDPRKIIDHKNRNKLDNRKENLRFCTNHQNCMNCNPTKGRKLPIGVSIKNNKFVARIMINRKEVCLGRFYNIEDAIVARKNGESLYFNGFRT